MKNSLGTKLYYSISEVAELTGLQPYTLRAWEREFSWLHPKRVRGKNRAYRAKDIGVILLIKSLLYEQRYTSEGVRKRLTSHPELVRKAAAYGVAKAQVRQEEGFLAGEDSAVAAGDDARTEGRPGSEGTSEHGRSGGAGRRLADPREAAELLQMARTELRALLELL